MVPRGSGGENWREGVRTRTEREAGKKLITRKSRRVESKKYGKRDVMSPLNPEHTSLKIKQTPER